MSRRATHRRGRKRNPAHLDAAAGIGSQERVAARKKRGVREGEGSWVVDRRRVFRFVIVLAVGVIGFNTAFALWIVPGAFFENYLRLNAQASATVLNVLGDNATVTGSSISSPRYSLSIKRGCEAMQVSAFFILAVLAWPESVSWRRRAAGLIVGTLLLIILNLVRIVSLYYTGIYFPRAFEVVHIDVWQPAFVVLALFFWVMWVRWASRPAMVKAHAVA